MKLKSKGWLVSLALGLAIGIWAISAFAAKPDPVRFGVATEQGELETVKAWLDDGLEPDFIADRIGSGLMIAAWEGNIPMMELFLKHGAQINLSNQYDEQALQLAAWRGHLEAVEWLLAHGANPNRNGQAWAALHYAAFADRQDIARLLLERGAEVNARAPNGSTALMMAAREGREQLALQLLEAGADPKATNESGDSALIWAMRHEHFKIAKMLSTPVEFAKMARAAPENFGTRLRSVPAPSEIEEILRQLRLAQAAGKSVEDLRKALHAAVDRFKKDSLKLAVGKVRPGKSSQHGKPQALVITARRGQNPNTAGERAELVYPSTSESTPPKSGDVAEILERMSRAQAAGRPVGDLRKRFFETVAQLRKDSQSLSQETLK